MLQSTRYPPPPPPSTNRRSSASSLRTHRASQQQTPKATTTATPIRRRPSLQLMNQQVQAVIDYLPSTRQEKRTPSLFFRKGTVIDILARTPNGWYQGQYDNIRGWFPSDHVGRPDHRLSITTSNNDAQHELDAWKASLIEQQKKQPRIQLSSRKSQPITNQLAAKGLPLRHRVSTSALIHTPASGTKQPAPNSSPPTIKRDFRSATPTSSLLRPSRVPVNSSTISTLPTSRTPLSSPATSLFHNKPCSSSQSSTSPSKPPSRHTLPANAFHPSPAPPVQQELTELSEAVSKTMFELVDACLSATCVPPPSNHQLGSRIHQATTSIRNMLAAVPVPADPAEQEMIADQRSVLLKLLSKVVHKGSELQLTGFLDDNAGFRAMVNQLWVEVVAFEEIIRSITVVCQPSTGTPPPCLATSSPELPPAIPAQAKALAPPRAIATSLDLAILTPRSSTCQFDQVVTCLFNHQTEIVDLLHTHYPSCNDLTISDTKTLALRKAKSATVNALASLIEVVREYQQPPTAPHDQPITPTSTPDVEPLSPTSPTLKPFEKQGDDKPGKESVCLISPKLKPQPTPPSPPPQPSQHSHLVKKQSAPNLDQHHRQRVSSQPPPPLPIHNIPPPPVEETLASPTFSSTSTVNNFDALPVSRDSNISLTSLSPCPSVSSITRPSSSHDPDRQLSTSTSSLIKRSSEFFRRNAHQSLDAAASSSFSNISSATLTSTDSAVVPSTTTSHATLTSSLQPSASISTSSSHRRLPRVTTLSNLAMRYLTSSSSSKSLKSSTQMPSSNPSASSSTANLAPASPTPSRPSIGSPPPQPTPSTSFFSHLRPSSSQEPALSKLSTSQSLRNMGVASLRSISRKPRRLSNQLRKSLDQPMSPPIPIPSRTIAATVSQDSPPMRLRLSISSSLRLRKSTDTDLSASADDDKTQEDKARASMQVEDDKSEAERTWYLHPQLNKSEIVYNSDGHLVGASLQVLIDMVTSHDRCPDALFIRSFFYNFRMFMEPLVLANMLKQRFNLSPPEHQDTHEPLTTEELELWQNDVRDPVRLRVYSVIKSWFEAYFDGAQDKEAARTLLPFVTSEMDLAMPVPARQMTELIELKLMTLTVSDTEVQNAICHSVEQAQDNQITLSPALIAAPCPSSTASTPIRNVFRLARLHHSHGPASTSTMASHATTSSRLTRIAVYRMDPQEIANQLTLMESTLFYAIPPSELIATQKKKSSTPVLHVRAMVHRSTLLVYWISNTILDELDTKARVHAIKFWIKVADACLQLNNFNTLMTIRCALNSASIARLKRTWDLAMRSTKYKTMYHTIDTVADSKRNFATYRKCLRQAVPPGLPFLGIFLSDMVFVDEGNLDLRFSTNGDLSLINFDKYVRMTQLLDQTIIRFQQVSYYKIKEIKEIQRYLLDCIESVNDNSEEQIYSKSLEIEPRIIDDD